MILVIDNYDSFTYNLVQYLGQCGAEVVVRRNDQISLQEIQSLKPDGIMLSPGPCTPTQSGVCLDVLGWALSVGRSALGSDATASVPQPYAASSEQAASPQNAERLTPNAFLPPIFGVCLGHQAIGHVAGGEVRQARNTMHGKTSMVRHDGKGLFEGMPNPFRAVRYHSLVVTKDSVPPGFRVTATAEDDGEIMGLRHETLPIEGVQFHPESVLTEEGIRIVENFVRRVETARRLTSIKTAL